MVKVYKPKAKKRRAPRTVKELMTYKRMRGDPFRNNPARMQIIKGYGFPDTIRMRLKYGDTQTLTSSVSNQCPNNGYRMNSIYDPDYSGAGGQPYWNDQLSPIYGRYRVLGCKITATFSRGTAATADIGPWLVGIQGTRATSLSSTNSSYLLNAPDTATKTLSQDSGNQTVSLTFSPRSVFGPHGADSDDLAAAIGANPNRNYLGFVFCANNGVTTATTVVAHIEVEYYVELSELILNAGS